MSFTDSAMCRMRAAIGFLRLGIAFPSVPASAPQFQDGAPAARSMEDGNRTTLSLGPSISGRNLPNRYDLGPNWRDGQLSHRTGGNLCRLSTPDGSRGPQANSVYRRPGRRDLHVRLVRHRDEARRQGTGAYRPRPQRRTPRAGRLAPVAVGTAGGKPRGARAVSGPRNTAAASAPTPNPSGRRSPACPAS